MNVLLLCAGLGTRFRPATEKLAKPALPFLNLPIIGYQIVYAEALGLENLVINTHHLPQTVQAAADRLLKPSYKTTFSHEKKILGSGGAIKNNEALLKSGGGDFVAINGDEVMVFNHGDGLSRVVAFHRANGALATLLTMPHPEAGRSLGGVWSDDSGRITLLGVKDPANAATAKHFAGVFVFSPRIFDFMPQTAGSEFHIFKDCLDAAIKKGEKVFAYNELGMKWFDTTDMKSYVTGTADALEVLLRDNEYAKNFWAIFKRYGLEYEKLGPGQWMGARAKFSGTIDSGGQLFMGPGSLIDSGVEVKGFAVLGENARFSQGFIESSAIAGGVHVNELVALRKQLLIGGA